MIGVSIGHYRVTAKLGAGGMGEVYRATDPRLNRDVAIKLLPEAVEHDPERLARFRREAQLLASLTHPNIAGVYGLEEQDGRSALVLELVEGETLADRIARGPIPVEDAREIARQIAEALEAAHERGIVHRDLKPANVKITPEGTVKVLDFGLAKALDPGTGGEDVSNSPTMTVAATQAGIVLGTAAYMAPEQAKGKRVDRRADVWAFGCVVYEMLAGRPPFEGDGVSEILAHVITQEPDFARLPRDLPPALLDLLRRSLRKDPRMRLPDIAAARIALVEMADPSSGGGSGGDAAGAIAGGAGRAGRGAWWIAAAALLVAVAAVSWAALRGEARVALPATRFDLVLDPVLADPSVALAADGSFLVYSGLERGRQRLYVRRLDGRTSEALPGTEGGHNPFLSPDGSEVGFFAAGRMKRVRLSGGLPESIVAVAGEIGGAVWTGDDTILFTSNSTVVPHRVPARGGPVAPIPIQDPPAGIEFLAPQLLPGGRTLIATATTASPDTSEIVAIDLATGAWSRLVRGSDARFVAPDRLLYVQQGRVMTVRIDPGKRAVVGEERPAALRVDGVDIALGMYRLHAAYSGAGVLVYPSGGFSRTSDVLRLSADGEVSRTGLTGIAPQVDSTGRRAVACNYENEVLLLDLVEGTQVNLTFLDTSWYPTWSHDDARILFADRRAGHWQTWAVLPDGSRPAESFIAASRDVITTSVARDGTLMGYRIDPETNRDIWVRPVGGEVSMLLATPANERVAAISPDGRLFAYLSDEEGTDQIYLRDRENLERRWRVSSEGGTSPVWSRDGRTLFYLAGDTITAVDVLREGGVRLGEERAVYTDAGLDADAWGNRTFDALPDGGLLVSVRRPSDVTLRVILGELP